MKKMLMGLLVLAFGLAILMIGCTSTTETTTTTTASTTTSSTTTTSADITTTTTTSTTSTSTDTTTTTTTSTTTSTSTTSTTTITSALSNGLIAHYAFDETSGTTASDSSGNGHAGTVYGASWEAGQVGNCLSFDGIDDCVKIPATSEAAPNEIGDISEGSIAVWFKFNGEAPFLLPILYLGDAPEVSDSTQGLTIELGHEGISDQSENLFYTVTLAGSYEPVFCYDSRIDLTAEAWYHFVVTVSSTGNTGYLNGEEMTNRRYNFPDDDIAGTSESYFLNDVTNGILSIGYGRFAYITTGKFYYFDGLIDDVRIYDRALSSAEALQLYQQ